MIVKQTMNLHDTQWKIRNKYSTDIKRIRTAGGNSKQKSITNRSGVWSVNSIILPFQTIAIFGNKKGLYSWIFEKNGSFLLIIKFVLFQYSEGIWSVSTGAVALKIAHNDHVATLSLTGKVAVKS